jgi:hypothetical protein
MKTGSCRSWCLLLAFTFLAAFPASAFTQTPGPNVNVISGFGSSDDVFLQRQNEPAIVALPFNPDCAFSAANDYRTIDFAGDPNVRPSAEAWIGVYRSCDRGRHWVGSLLPGFPTDTSTAGTSSPLFGLAAAADPVLAAGTTGKVYLGGIAFDRGGVSRVFVARYTGLGSSSGYDFTRIVDVGTVSSNGIFVDKPWIIADVPRAGGALPTACGNVYFSYTIFDGVESNGNFRSKVMFARSTDCGETFSRPIKLNMNYNRNQGTAMAVDPNTGALYVAWRHFGEDRILLVKSTDGGLNFSNPTSLTLSPIASFDQPTISTPNETFRTNGFPSIVADGQGRVYAAWQERVNANGSLVQIGTNGIPVAGGSPRIVLTTSFDGGLTWTARQTVENATGAQVMPSLSLGGGILRLLYYQSQGDVGSNGFITGIDRKVDVRIAQSVLPGPAGANPGFSPSVQVSQYLPNQSSKPNYPMYRAGTTPFFGDYIYLAPAAGFVRTSNSTLPWRWATEATDAVAQNSYAVWTDHRDVLPPSVGSWPGYSPPGTGQPSCLNPGSRNANIYFSEINPGNGGVLASSPQTSKPLKQPGLLDSLGRPIQTSFVVTVINPGNAERYFRLTLTDNLPVTNGSFAQFQDRNAVEVRILAGSSVTRTVYVNSSDPYASVRVDVQQITGAGGSVVAGGSNTSVTFLGDPGNAQVDNIDLYDAQISNAQVSNAQISNGPIAATDVSWTVTNTGNTTAAYFALVNVADVKKLLNGGFTFQLFSNRGNAVPGLNGCTIVGAAQDLSISNISNAQVDNAQIDNAQIDNAQVDNAQISNATFYAAPASDSAASTLAAGSALAPASDAVTITLRIIQNKKGQAFDVTKNPVTLYILPQGTNVDEATRRLFSSSTSN